MDPPASAAIILPEAEAQVVWLVWAIEEEDRQGALLPHLDRRRATAVEPAVASPEGWLPGRARELVGGLATRLAELPSLLRWSRLPVGLSAPLLALALAVGLATNALGPERRIHVLALPLVGILAWNLAVLGFLVLRRWLPLPDVARRERPRLLEWLEAWIAGWAERRGRLASGGEEEAVLVRRAYSRYLAVWLGAAAPLAAARTRRLLHGTAVALLLGTVGGMYVRGLLFEYRASWESTFLSPAVVEVLLGAALSPAAWVLGIEVPSAAAIASPASGEAAPWIHLWAATAGLFVVGPRVALWSAESWLCRRLARRVVVTLPEAYLRRVAASASTEAHRVEVVACGAPPSTRSAEALSGLLADLMGPRTDVRFLPVVRYGDGPPDAPAGQALRVVLCGLEQTPESEVHGELLRSLAGQEGAAGLLVIVDGAVFRRRSTELGVDPGRREERRRAWDGVVREAGLVAVHLDLEEPLPPEALTEAAGAVRPEGALG